MSNLSSDPIVFNTNHQPSNGGQPRDSLGRSSPKGDSLKGPPINLPIGSFGWAILDPCTLIPPWYQPPIVQPVQEPITKLTYKKL
jgi:hypothetical protein